MNCKQTIKDLESLVVSENQHLISFRLLRIYSKGILWEIDNPLGENLILAKVYLSRDRDLTIKSVRTPNIEDIKKGNKFPIDSNLEKELGPKLIRDGTCISFPSVNDALVYLNKVCGNLIGDYTPVTKLYKYHS